MSAASRRKGLVGEREVADRYEQAGYAVRGLEGSGDHLVICKGALVLHSEVKRTEKLRLYEALGQATSEAPAGTVPVLHFRRNRDGWFVALRLDDWLGVLDG